MSKLDILYPYKLTDSGDELRYSLRSLSNVDHVNVFVVGQTPRWLSTEAYALIVPQNKGKFQNLCNNIRLGCLLPGLSDPFIIMNDDFFIMKRTEEIRDLYRSDIHTDVERLARQGMFQWLDGMERVRNELKGERSYELHVPMVIHKEPMLEALDRIGPTPVWRTAYGAVAGLTGYPYNDVKVKDMNTPATGRFVSTSNQTFRMGRVGKDIRKSFPQKSRYEV